MDASADGSYCNRETEGTGLGLRPAQRLILVDEHDHQPHDEKDYHHGAQEIVVVVDRQKRNVQVSPRAGWNRIISIAEARFNQLENHLGLRSWHQHFLATTTTFSNLPIRMWFRRPNVLCRFRTPNYEHLNGKHERVASEMNRRMGIRQSDSSVNRMATIYLDRKRKTKLEVPLRLSSYRTFDRTLLRARSIITGEAPSCALTPFLNRMYYLLGWFLGDLGKQFGPRRLMTASLNLTLSKRHSENKELGDFVFFDCIQKLGIQAKRVGDRGPDKSSPYGAYRWDSARSSVFGWIHTSCLGLDWAERASSVSIRMEWILSAPIERRLWFVRGLADSDGDVHFKDKSVAITTSPNTEFVNSLLRSLGCRTHVEVSPGFSKVVLSAPQAAKMRIFSPEVLTYRRKTLEKLVNAKTFERRWPDWLQAKVTRLIASGLSTREIRDRVLDEDNVFVRLHTIKRKRAEYGCVNTKLVDGAGGGIPVFISSPRLPDFSSWPIMSHAAACAQAL